MKINALLLLLGTIIFTSINAQSLIVGIPSADVAEKNHLEITHESQIGKSSWNSFNFACYGLGKGWELTSTLNNLNNQGSSNLALGLGFKKIIPLNNRSPKTEQKLILGTNMLYAFQRKDPGIWSYAMYSFRIPASQTRFTGGVTYGESQTFGFKYNRNLTPMVLQENNRFEFLGGIEQPIAKGFSIIGDWYQGTHDLAAFIPAVQKDIGHHVLIVGYKIANNPSSGSNAFILEAMISIPTKRKR
jgi:hypothetical protein